MSPSCLSMPALVKAAVFSLPLTQNFNAASVTNIRNQHIAAYAPMSEALYEGLCLYRKGQGPCYSNSGSWSTGYSSGGLGASGDPFFFVSMNQSVRCCKNYRVNDRPWHRRVLMAMRRICNHPSAICSQGPTSGWTTSGAAGDRLDDVAYYGRTHDLRSDLGRNSVCHFLCGQRDGGAWRRRALLASAAKYGGFKDWNNDNAVELHGIPAV